MMLKPPDLLRRLRWWLIRVIAWNDTVILNARLQSDGRVTLDRPALLANVVVDPPT